MRKHLQTFFAVCLMASATVSFGQITGDLRGLVLDGQGGAVTQATVTLRSLDTGEVRKSAVTAGGTYNFALLKIGNYEVKAEAAGFRTVTTQAQVKAGEVADVRFAMEVGQVTETVTVTDAVAQLDTQNAQIQAGVVGRAVLDIPVNRNPNLFALMLPGVAPVTANNSFLGSGSFNSNGGRGRGNNITVDGITTTDVSVTGTGGALTPLIFNTIAEVKVITNNFSAEYGRNSSAQVLYLTKSGSNNLHGELFEYFQNDKLNARPFFDRTGKTNITRFNQYGFVVGGPVFIPKVVDLRNRAFFNVAYEGQKQRGAGATRIARVPTPTQAASVTDPTSKALMTQYQVPTDPSGQLTTAAPNVSDVWKLQLRGDFNLTSKDTLWVRYNPSSQVSASTSLTFVGSNLPGFGATNAGTPRQAVAAHTHTFSPTVVNEFRFGFGQSDAGFPIDTPYPLGSRLIFQDAGVTSLGVWEGLPQGREQKTYEFTDNVTVVRGSHNVKMGGSYYYLQADSIFDSSARPVFNFASFATFAAGTPATYAQRLGDSFRKNRVKNIFAYVQDDWKVSRNLTVNLGLRMEFAGGPTEKDGRISNLNLNNNAPYGAAGGGPFGLLEVGKPSFDSNYNWGPRLGFAWMPGGSQKTVIRGGYGIAYDFVFLNPITNQRFLPPLMITASLTGAGITGGNSYASLVAGNSTIQQQTLAQIGTLSQSVRNFGAISPAIAQNLSNPQVHQFNVGVQRELMNGLVVKANYVGTKGNYLPRSRDLNLVGSPLAAASSVTDETARLAQFQAQFTGLSGGATTVSNRIDPRYNAIVWVDSSANSNYHSAQFEVTKRMSDLLITASYTFAKSIDDGSDVLGVLINDSSNQQNPLDNRNNRSVSQFDLNQRLAITHNWEIPWLRGSSNWFVRTVVAGWGFSGITSFRTGFPVTLDAGVRRGLSPLTVLGGGAQVRPNIAGPVNINWVPAGSAGAPFGTASPDGVQAVSSYATGLGLSQPLLGNFGTMGRNVLRLNGERNFDWNFYKNFNITESVRFQFRAEFYNVFNNTSFQDVSRVITAPDFGQYTSVGQNARFIQLGGRFVF